MAVNTLSAVTRIKQPRVKQAPTWDPELRRANMRSPSVPPGRLSQHPPIYARTNHLAVFPIYTTLFLHSFENRRAETTKRSTPAACDQWIFFQHPLPFHPILLAHPHHPPPGRRQAGKLQSALALSRVTPTLHSSTCESDVYIIWQHLVIMQKHHLSASMCHSLQ
ncbi:unnamed protein product [Periconia digitata]|uniref:Uncharacterized protein n=1 Tax=Periconia digitata TaxID=1303443 RepID=A0A9W4ULM1_9PLEO|nr:unnamed protein product [Periconia digitata]